MRKLTAILIIAMAFTLAAPCIAFADKKKVNSEKNDSPSESLSLSYGKIQPSYTSQSKTQPKSGNSGSAIKSGSGMKR